METTAGQAVQAASILRKLAPNDQLYAAQRTVSKLELLSASAERSKPWNICMN